MLQRAAIKIVALFPPFVDHAPPPFFSRRRSPAKIPDVKESCVFFGGRELSRRGKRMDSVCRDRQPDFWQDSEEYSPNSAAKDATHCLTEDFCVLNSEHFFVRCVLELTLLGAPGIAHAYRVE
jgi:hypothetical protein